MKLASSPSRKFFDDDACAGSAHAVVDEHHVDCGMSFRRGDCDDDALAGGQPVGFDDDRRALSVDVTMRRSGITKSRIRGGGYAMPHHETLGEILGAFELRCRLGGTEDAQTGCSEGVDDAIGERRFGPDDRQTDAFCLHEIDQR